jgi:hypothetical protein
MIYVTFFISHYQKHIEMDLSGTMNKTNNEIACDEAWGCRLSNKQTKTM